MPKVTLHDGTRVRWREAGAGRSGVPMVLVHGAGASSAIWLNVMRRLARERRVIAIDLPGHGGSSGRPTSVEELRDAVGMTCAALCTGPAILVGHSLGGPVVLDAAMTWPDKVAAAAVVTSGARLKVSRGVFDALTEERWPRWPEMLAEVGYSPDTPADTRRRGAGIATCATGREQTELDFRAAAAWDGRARVGGLACPLLVVTGEHDLLTPPRWGEALAAAVPGSRLVSIRSAGHMPMHEKPDDLTGHLRDFAAGVTPRTR